MTRKWVSSMPIGLVLLLGFIAVLVIGWLVMAYKSPPLMRRNSADYRYQHTENPDYFPGHGGAATGG